MEADFLAEGEPDVLLTAANSDRYSDVHGEVGAGAEIKAGTRIDDEAGVDK